jgi:hypothetical protein
MSTTTNFISELIRAANEIHTLTAIERTRLIERAAATIQAQRDMLAMRDRVVPLSFDVTADLGKLKQEASGLPEVLSAVVMLKCADEIRRLRILLKSD